MLMANAWGNAVAQLHLEHRQTCGNMLRSIQFEMLIALHRSKRWAFAEWIGTELDSALDMTVKSELSRVRSVHFMDQQSMRILR